MPSYASYIPTYGSYNVPARLPIYPTSRVYPIVTHIIKPQDHLKLCRQRIASPHVALHTSTPCRLDRGLSPHLDHRLRQVCLI